MCHNQGMALARQSKNTYRKIKSWLKNQADPWNLIAHSRSTQEERREWADRLREAEGLLMEGK